MPNSLAILPLTPEQLDAGIKIAVEKLTVQGLSNEEALIKLGQEFDKWLDGPNPDGKGFHGLEDMLSQAAWASPSTETPSGCYKDLVRDLSNRFKLSRREAAIVLSQLPLILLLARDFRASPARIVGLVSHSQARMSINWRMADFILKKFGIRSVLDKNAVEHLLTADRLESIKELGDATVASMLDALEAQATSIGLDHVFQNGLRSLFSPHNKDTFIPYLQILLYIAVTDHFFDHPSEFIYTFKPRGRVANIIFRTFPSSLAPGGNPMLNNFKAVDRLTSDWAESRDDAPDQASALIDIVKGLSSLAHSARSEMSRGIRRAIIRFIDIKTPPTVHLEEQTRLAPVKRFLASVGEMETGTKGVIEQRVADFFGVLDYAPPEWRARGLGDPVNASNSSSGKLGDCDFQNVGLLKCVAIEAHAGRLTDVYVVEHLRTLHLNLQTRRKEWSHISEIDNWKLHLRFFVHEDARTQVTRQPPTHVEKFEVIKYLDHLNFMSSRMEQDAESVIELFNRWVIAPLNAANTPILTRTKAKKLLGC